MKHKIMLPLVAAVPLAIAGCATNATYIPTGGPQGIVNVGQINIQDYLQAANASVQDLLKSGVLDHVQNPPAVLYISTIKNDTGQQIDTDLLTHRITDALIQSGKAVADTTFGPEPEDQAAAGIAQEYQFMHDQESRLPDFSLSGDIIQTVARAGRTRQSTYTFQLTLTSKRTGYAVWEEDKDITKQGTQPAVGW